MEEWERNRFGEGKALVLVRDVAACLSLYAKGFSLDSIQIGELPNGRDGRLYIRLFLFQSRKWKI